MRIDGRVRIAALSTYLPGTTERTVRAVAEGLLSEKDARSSGYVELPVSTVEAAPEMAVLAAAGALGRAGLAPGDLDLVAHAWIYHQGHDFWSPAHFVAAQLGADRAEPIGVQQMCNGGAAAIEIAISRLLADPDHRTALVTTADCFDPEGFDRWHGDYGIVYGDGATAAVLTTSPGPAADGLELLSVSTVAAADLEWMHRGEDPFTPAGRMLGRTVDVRRTKKAFLAATGKDAFAGAVAARVSEVLARGLAEAGVTPAEPKLVLMPRIGVAGVTGVYQPAVAAVLPAPVVDLGRHTGHLGAGDLTANLAAACDDELLRPGEIGVALSAGAGMTWTCVVFRRPDPDDQTNTEGRTS
jgi:3-oxoacyl-[acyl-carrier-protein] synthase-3